MRRRTVVLAAIVSLGAGQAQAGDRGDRVQSYAFWCGLKAADNLSTEWVLARNSNVYEANPMPGMQSTWGRTGIGVGTCVGLAEIDQKLKPHKKSRLIVRVAGALLFGFVATHNMRQGGR